MSDEDNNKEAAKARSFGNMELKQYGDVIYGTNRDIGAMALLELKREAMDLMENISFFTE